MEKCKDCKYNADGNCAVVLYENGETYRIGLVDDEHAGCALWEKREVE